MRWSGSPQGRPCTESASASAASALSSSTGNFQAQSCDGQGAATSAVSAAKLRNRCPELLRGERLSEERHTRRDLRIQHEHVVGERRDEKDADVREPLGRRLAEFDPALVIQEDINDKEEVGRLRQAGQENVRLANRSD